MRLTRDEILLLVGLLAALLLGATVRHYRALARLSVPAATPVAALSTPRAGKARATPAPLLETDAP